MIAWAVDLLRCCFWLSLFQDLCSFRFEFRKRVCIFHVWDSSELWKVDPRWLEFNVWSRFLNLILEFNLPGSALNLGYSNRSLNFDVRHLAVQVWVINHWNQNFDIDVPVSEAPLLKIQNLTCDSQIRVFLRFETSHFILRFEFCVRPQKCDVWN